MCFDPCLYIYCCDDVCCHDHWHGMANEVMMAMAMALVAGPVPEIKLSSWHVWASPPEFLVRPYTPLQYIYIS